MSLKHTTQELDAGQLDLMWNFLRVGEIHADAKDIEHLIENVDAVRQILIQKSGGQRNNDPRGYLDSRDLGTYINLIVCDCLALRIGGVLDRLAEEMRNGTDTGNDFGGYGD